jgi:hypothetical protein
MQTDRKTPSFESPKVEGDAGRKDRPATDAFHRLGEDLGELREYVSFFISAKLDALKLSMMKVVILAGLGLLALIAATALTATAVVLLFTGFADGLGILLGGRPWLGGVIVGVLVLGFMAGASVAVWKVWRKGSLKRTVQKYEERQHRQFARFGRDVSRPDGAAPKR